jgi:hypothetical protein
MLLPLFGSVLGYYMSVVAVHTDTGLQLLFVGSAVTGLTGSYALLFSGLGFGLLLFYIC